MTEELSTHLVDEDGNSHNSKDESSTRLLVQFWDASNGALISNRLFEVKDVAVTRFSPNGQLAILTDSHNYRDKCIFSNCSFELSYELVYSKG